MTTLLVAATGGHLAQLHELAARIDLARRDRLWVTFDSPQSRSLLTGERKLLVPEIAERDAAGVVRAAWRARRLLRPGRVEAVVSTGSAIALAFLPLAALRGIEAHYIESSARVGAPSLTGRVLEQIPGVRLYRQYPHAATGRWRYGGSVFDGFAVVPGTPRPIRRVVVTLGGVRQGFRRLLARLAAILPPGAEVLWQTGHTSIDGLGIPARPFVPAVELQQAMREADVVVAHGGCGSALAALKAGRLPVLVPRDPHRGELVDGHQPELTGWLDRRGLAIERSPETLSPADLEAAAALRVERRSDPPPFELALWAGT